MTDAIPYISKTEKKIIGDMEVETKTLTVQGNDINEVNKIFIEHWRK